MVLCASPPGLKQTFRCQHRDLILTRSAYDHKRMRPLKPMVGVVKSLELIGSGPVGLVRTQESTGFLKRKAHLIVVAFIGLHLDPVGNVVLGPSRTVTYRRPRSQLRAPRDYVKALLNHQEGDVTGDLCALAYVRREARSSNGH
jgi:hypothetical protein